MGYVLISSLVSSFPFMEISVWGIQWKKFALYVKLIPVVSKLIYYSSSLFDGALLVLGSAPRGGHNGCVH